MKPSKAILFTLLPCLVQPLLSIDSDVAQCGDPDYARTTTQRHAVLVAGAQNRNVNGVYFPALHGANRYVQEHRANAARRHYVEGFQVHYSSDFRLCVR